MNPPKCRYCGHPHWLSEGHVGMPDPKKEVLNKIMGEAGTQAKHRQKVSADNDQLPMMPTKFDRTAYQRDYMRKYRAKRNKS